MKYLIIALIFSMPVMASKKHLNHYRLTAEESNSDWLYYYKLELNVGSKINKVKIEKCYNMNEVNYDRVEIPCSEMDKFKSTLDARELGVTERSASAF